LAFGDVSYTEARRGPAGAPPVRIEGSRPLVQPICHFEIIGKDAANLRRYYGELFGWEFNVGDPATNAVSESGNYGFVEGSSTGGINGGVGGGTALRLASSST
jgi:hypothetical protein